MSSNPLSPSSTETPSTSPSKVLVTPSLANTPTNNATPNTNSINTTAENTTKPTTKHVPSLVTPISSPSVQVAMSPRTSTPLSSATLSSTPLSLSSTPLSSSTPIISASPSLSSNALLHSSGPVLFSTGTITLPDAWGSIKTERGRGIGGGDNSEYEVVKSSILVGRGKDADLKLPSHLRSTSNKHCVISIGREVDVEGKPWFTYITDFSVNGTYVDGKRIPKGQRSLLLDGSSISLVSPKSEDDSSVRLTFTSHLAGLPVRTLQMLDSEFDDPDGQIGITKRLQQLQSTSAQQTMKNAKKPEAFIYVLKVEATCPNLLLLHDTLKWSIQSNEKWIETFVSLGGVSAVLDVIAVNNRKSRTFEADVSIDVECLKILDDFISYPPGLEALVSQRDSMDDVVLTLLNPNHAVRVKTTVISIFLHVCSHSEVGYKVIVNCMERLQKVKRERSRFLFLVHSLITEQDQDYKVKCMTLINSIISSPSDLTQRAKHKVEFVNLGLMRIVEVLYQEHNTSLEVQLEIFTKHMDEDDMFYRTINLEDPMSVCKAIIDQIRRYKDPSASFVSTLRRILALCCSSPSDTPDSNFYSNLGKSFDVVTKLVSTLTEISMLSNDSATSYSQRLEQVTNNLQSLAPAPDSPKSTPETTETTPPPPSAAPPPPPPPPPPSNAPPPPPPPPLPGGGPPPPPPPPGGGPPPPPPPPGGGPPGPPPPPGKKGPPLPTKKPEDLPKVPMRQLFWTKMAPAKIKGTVWDPDTALPTAATPSSPALLHRFANALSPTSSSTPSTPTFSPPSTPAPPPSPSPSPTPAVAYDQVKLNKDELENIFCAKKQKGATTAAAAPKQEEIKEVSLLDMRRSNNLGIVLSRLKLTPESIREDLMGMDEKLLSKEKVVALIKCVPTADEEALVKGYAGDAPLAPVEQFLLQMLKIPRVGPRLECIQFKLGLDSSLNEVKEAVDSVAKACHTLMNDDSFKQLLMIVLRFGNFMNGGSARGSAVGFKINCLLNLSETKSTDNKTTLLHYLVMYIRQNAPTLLDKCETIFRCAEPVSRIVWKEILGQYEQIKSGMSKVEAELQHYPENSIGDQFRPVMAAFVQNKKSLVTKLGSKVKDVDSVFITTASYYGEEGVSPEDFFSILHDFNTVFMKAQRDNERERVAAAKREAIAAQKKKLEAATPEPKAPKIDITHNMFKILDSKRVRKGSPLASPTLTPSTSADNLFSKTTLQSSTSLPAKLSSANSKPPTINGIIVDKTTSKSSSPDLTISNNNNNNNNNNVTSKVNGKITPPSSTVIPTAASPNTTTHSPAYPLTPNKDTPQSNRPSFNVKSSTK